MMNTWRQRLEKCSTLPTLPSVAIKVLQLCQEDDLSFTKISDIISNDPALTVKVLKMVNSPVYGLRHEVVKLSQALGLLGVNAVRGLVLSFSLPRSNPTGNKGAGLRNYWRRSVISALAAREICRSANNPQQEEVFLGALLQDIGMLALARVAGDRYEELLSIAGGDHDKAAMLEKEEIGADHVEVGAWLLQRWRVPEAIVEMVSGSHNPNLIPAEAKENLHFAVKAVAISGRFADIWVQGDPVAANVTLRQQSEAIFGSGQLDIEGICKRLLAAIPEVASLFEVQLDAQEMAAVLEEAQEALAIAMAELESSTASLRQEAQRDYLTGLPNRGQLESQIAKEFGDALSLSQNLGLIFADVDHFKKVNDTHGHSSGDAVLQSIAQCLESAMRRREYVGRFGGEEFIVLLPGASKNEIQIAAERLRVRIEECDHPIGNGKSLKVTISLGCASFDALRHVRPKDLVDEADQALYAAKRSGRNRVEFLEQAKLPTMTDTTVMALT